MSQITVLVIDDSTTIRRLVDSHLSPGGYNVLLAESAEKGLDMAIEHQPDLILLDHQLPGTTGSQVCQQILGVPELAKIPIVVSSTLRKRAYAEYTEFANVVDMLPKPYTPELLLTTVSNALDTGKLIVESQSEGTAIPEVTQQVADASLVGNLELFGLRQVIDFLNFHSQKGALEVDTDQDRIWFFLDQGRIQGVTAPGSDPSVVADVVPAALNDLAPVLNFTVGGHSGAQLESLVDLLDKKVLDPRLLRNLLRFQSAILSWRCFHSSPKAFQFHSGSAAPALFNKLRLDIGLASLLVDASIHLEDGLTDEPDLTFVRSSQRGLNLDRAGLSAAQLKVLNGLETPATIQEISARTGVDSTEITKVLHGLLVAGWLTKERRSELGVVLALETDLAGANCLRDFLQHSEEFSGKVVRDRLGFQLLWKRQVPDIVLIEDMHRDLVTELSGDNDTVKVVTIVAQPRQLSGAGAELTRPYSERDIETVLTGNSDSENLVTAESALTF